MNAHAWLILLVPTISAIGIFALLTVSSWAKARQRERESFHRTELLRRLTETSGEAAVQILELLREEDAAKIRRRREGLILAGMIWLAVGAGFVGIGRLNTHLEHDGSWALGILPMFAGAAILVHAAFFATRPGTRGR
jgi:hypothetical protein